MTIKKKAIKKGALPKKRKSVSVKAKPKKKVKPKKKKKKAKKASLLSRAFSGPGSADDILTAEDQFDQMDDDGLDYEDLEDDGPEAA